ncbi:LRR domain containing protein [Trema orientale]|uniref:LRR domain containing protein n=1 Tax=Trema orientale TaxID=63057 RepID=A0A2P5EGW6_TREOI|nr:LRR domain containing protein [Trema orientale]
MKTGQPIQYDLKEVSYDDGCNTTKTLFEDIDCSGISLKELNISDSSSLISLPKDGLPQTLKALGITDCRKLKSLDYMGLRHLMSLKELKIHDCPKLRSIPNNSLPSSLDFIHISNCPLLKKKGLGKYGQNWARIAPNACIQMDNEVILCDQA